MASDKIPYDSPKLASFPCRSCGDDGPHDLVISLGRLPVGTALLRESDLDKNEPYYPLDLALCGKCSLLQVQETIPIEDYLEQNYYLTLASGTVLEEAKVLAESLIETRRLGPESLVIEIGSNNGTLLECFQAKGVPVLGIEPISEIGREAEETYGIHTVKELFGESLARSLADSGKSADVVIANYVVELIPDLGDFMRGLEAILKEDGTAVIEVPYVRDMAERCRMDGIAHLRVNWFSAASISYVFRSHGLELWDVEHLPNFRGGMLRAYASPLGANPKPSVQALLQEEHELGVDTPVYYRSLNRRFGAMRKSVRSFLKDLREQDQVRVAAFGAGVKASNFLNYVGLDQEFVDFVVDGTPFKQGQFMPGVHLPIHPPEMLLEEMPSYVLMLALDFTDEILAQQEEFRNKGGHFIIPGDELKIV